MQAEKEHLHSSAIAEFGGGRGPIELVDRKVREEAGRFILSVRNQ